jgi:hypothetical protein
MALMLGNLYEALREAGATHDKALAAAEEGASYESRLARIESDTRLLKWMVGVNIAITLGGLSFAVNLLFRVLERLPHS